MVTECLTERWWARVEKSGECWIWRGAVSDGRTVFCVGTNRYTPAQRYSLELHGRPVQGDVIVKRTCGEQRCVRPEHLVAMPRRRIGTQPIPTAKECRHCGVIKSAREFPRKAQKVDGLESYCRACCAERQREWNLRKYNLTAGEYDAMLAEQGGTCAACGDASCDRLRVDHDHETGEVRGLLCNGCNCAAGQAKDDPDRLRAIARYLERCR